MEDKNEVVLNLLTQQHIELKEIRQDFNNHTAVTKQLEDRVEFTEQMAKDVRDVKESVNIQTTIGFISIIMFLAYITYLKRRT